MKILVLGGTTEARALAGRLAERGFDAVLSLAGRTQSPREQGAATRIGGFGGVDGLAVYLRHEAIDALIDATHPYANTISENAARAAAQAGVSLVALRRAAWQQTQGDQWIEVEDIDQAVETLGAAPRRVFLAIGRNAIEPFTRAPQHTYLVRSVDPVDPPLDVPHAMYLTARGPFNEADDRALLERYKIDVIVAKNSGGAASYGKIAAARALHLPVVMLKRPEPPDVVSVETIDDVSVWLDHACTLVETRGE